jgi:hypothetical protein
MSSTIWKRTPNSAAKWRKCRQSRPFVRTLHEEQYALDGGADQAAGLELVQAAQARGALRDERLDVDVLAADHAVDAGGGGELADGLEQVGGVASLLVEDELERLGVEAVAGEDGDVLAVLDVAGGPAAAQIVVVHGREVVVDEAVVWMSSRAAASGRTSAGSVPIALAVASASTGRMRLPPGQQAVAHGLLEALAAGSSAKRRSAR